MSLPETPTRVVLFLSTLSLRRATFLFADHIELRAISIHALLAESDNLRVVDGSKSSIISIHALLAESDVTVLGIQHKVGISIHALLAESDHSAPVPRRPDANISIHALLAESDFFPAKMGGNSQIFLSTLSLRRATGFCQRYPCI